MATTSDNGKLILFAGLGAAGCFLAALVGEIWFSALEEPLLEKMYRALIDGNRLAAYFWKCVFTGGWTAILGSGISMALVGGQNHYLKRPVFSQQEVRRSLLGGLVAGACSGIAAEIFFTLVQDTESAVTLEFMRAIAWFIFGVLVGIGLSFFVPNLGRSRAALGGGLGGLVGAVAFILFTSTMDDSIGRIVGMTIVGLAIGMALAIMEIAFRSAWLEVSFGPRETISVNLGQQPVCVGSDTRICAVYARGVRAIAYRYRVVDGQVICDDMATEMQHVVVPGTPQQVGNLVITVRVSDKARSGGGPDPPPPPPKRVPGSSPSPKEGYQLCIRGRRFPLNVGSRLGSSELAGLETTEPDGSVAEVTAHPNDPKLLGLKNLCTRPWKATMPDGSRKEVATGKNVRLITGVQIDFGVLKGSIE